MKYLRMMIAVVAVLGFTGSAVLADATDAAALDITIDAIYYVSVGTAADWTDSVTFEDLNATYIQSALLENAMDVAGTEAYEVTAQMSTATWDGAVSLTIAVNAAAETTLNDSTATEIVGLDEEVAGQQDDLSVQWKLDGITWANTANADDWTNTVTFTCQEATI